MKQLGASGGDTSQRSEYTRIEFYQQQVAEHYKRVFTEESNLVLKLGFDRDLLDRSGQGNNGVLNGNAGYAILGL